MDRMWYVEIFDQCCAILATCLLSKEHKEVKDASKYGTSYIGWAPCKTDCE